MSTKERIYDLASEIFEVRKEELKPGLSWEDAAIESFALVEFVVAIQEEFRVRIETTDLSNVHTLEAFVKKVEEKISQTK
jgi:acyl carrier protein